MASLQSTSIRRASCRRAHTNNQPFSLRLNSSLVYNPRMFRHSASDCPDRRWGPLGRSGTDPVITQLRYCSFSYEIILTLTTWTLPITVDNISMLNCLVFSGLIVLVGLRKSLLNVTVFLQYFSFNSIAYIYLLVTFLFCLFFSGFFMCICYH